ncbi:hypothetical protein V5O48_018044 [Marasmius crinis-equi]|uniref:Wax synthase domain-containing protein n=1 Tax=Marasmius crinis-equi TaxID=585013 RepID=A0ABR3EM88_9AGAR
MRSITWGLSRTQYHRTHESPANKLTGIRRTLLDSIDITLGSRGIGWNWSKGLLVPAHTRPTSNEAAFVLYTFASLGFHMIFYDSIHYHIQSMRSFNLLCPKGSTIYNHNLPPLQRYALSTYISLLSGWVVYAAIQSLYDMATLVGVIVFQQNPSRWPPIFDEPWKATSLTSLWAKRWHQVFRQCFISIGSPFSYAFGRVGEVLGAFFVSGILHYLGLWGMARGSDWGMIGFFMAMGIGIILENLWKRTTGRKVGGAVGWMWTFTWLLGWANILIDGWARKGLIATRLYPENYRPAEILYGPLSYAVC